MFSLSVTSGSSIQGKEAPFPWLGRAALLRDLLPFDWMALQQYESLLTRKFC